jgi:hypothetical protein
MPAQLSRLRTLVWAVLAAGLATTLGVLASADGEANQSLLRPLVALTVLPYLLLAIGAGWLARTRGRAAVFVAAAVAIGVGGAVLLYEAFVANPGPLADLALILVPIYQTVLALGALLVVAVLHLRPRDTPVDD